MKADRKLEVEGSGWTVFQFLNLTDDKTEHPRRRSYLPRSCALITDGTKSWPWNAWHFTALAFYSVPFGNETFIYWAPIKGFKICICYKNMLINIRHDPHP